MNKRVNAAILETLETQIRTGDPPETRATLKRLTGDGMTRPEAVKLIAAVVADEMFYILKGMRSFDEQRFVANLKRLPELPEETPSGSLPQGSAGA